jgi:hypothetical protein
VPPGTVIRVPDLAQASLAVGLCRAGRLLGSASLLFTGLSFAVLAFGDQDSLLRLVWLTVALSGMPALYLAATPGTNT